jgi:uncharacterized protein (TIGR02171 family)
MRQSNEPGMKKRAVFCAVSAILSTTVLFSCSTKINEPGDPETAVHPGMKKIDAAGKSFLQGAADSSAGSDEKPAVRSSFSYSYWLDTTEVTQQEYARVTGAFPLGDFSTFGQGDDYPVYYVSWFDAILFCNAKSKLESLDTVYSYSGAPQTSAGSVYNLTGLVIHYDRDGYRLPTEAEWEYAAREGTSSIPFPHLADTATAGGYAWYSFNAGGTSRPVATKAANGFGLYDMAGNVFEWVNDWKGFYTGDSIENSLGCRYSNANYERVVKGGAFSHGFLSLRPSRRSATYATSHAIRTEYIGFRCARGVIAEGHYIDAVSSVTPNSVSLVSADAPSFLGTSQARLVFVNVTRNLRTLCFVDFAEATPQVYEFEDSTNVYSPAISPDGRFVAYATRGTGFGDASSIYVRRLDARNLPPVRVASGPAFSPRWWVDPVSLATYLVYTNSSIDNASSQWSFTTTSKIAVNDGIPAGQAAAFLFNGSFHDGISANGRYCVTGFTKLLMQDMETGEVRQLFKYPQNGKTGEGQSQVCNVSMCPGPTWNDRCLFLDFGAPQGSSLTGDAYGVHEYLFVADYSGTVLSWLRHPAAEYSWDYPKWSNVERYAVSGARNASEEAHTIYLVDLVDSAYRKVVEGTVVEDPGLWISPPLSPDANPDSLDLDSLGYYNDPPLYQGQDFFARRMHSFWLYKDSFEIVSAGSSHLCHAIDPTYMPHNRIYNLAFNDCMISTMFTILENYLLNHCPRVKLLVLDVLIGCLNYPEYFEQSWNGGIINGKGHQYDLHHDYWKTGLPRNFVPLLVKAPGPEMSDLDTLGVFHSPGNGWGGEYPETMYAMDWTTSSYDYTRNMSHLKAFIDTCRGRNIKCLLVVTPESPAYKNTGFFTRYGPSWENGRMVIQDLQTLADTTDNCWFYDAYREGNHDYTDEDAYDMDHLSSLGARKFSARLDSVLVEIRKQP